MHLAISIEYDQSNHKEQADLLHQALLSRLHFGNLESVLSLYVYLSLVERAHNAVVQRHRGETISGDISNGTGCGTVHD